MSERTSAPLAPRIGAGLVVVGVIGVLVPLFQAQPVDPLALGGAGLVALAGLLLTVRTALASVGLLEGPEGPWRHALQRLAAEHGQEVQLHPERGLWFDAIHGGPRLTVSLFPERGTLELRGGVAGRHGMVVLRRGDSVSGDLAAWPEAFRGAGWSFRAEVRIAARGLEEARPLHLALDRFFALAGARRVAFDHDGLRVSLELPHPDSTERAVRTALDAARAIVTTWAH